MAAIPTVSAGLRTEIGTVRSRRLRRSGKVPGNIYGLGRENTSVSFTATEISPIVAAGAHVLSVDVTGELCTAIVREAQWDTYFTKLLHLDLQRVDPDARVTMVVPVEVRGVVSAGVLEQPVHSVSLHCLAYQVPAVVVVRVTTLRVGDSITVSQLELPDGAVCELPGDLVVVRVHDSSYVDIGQAEPEVLEPELIGRASAKAGAE